MLLHDNLDNLSEWLERVAEDNPERAIEIILKMSEYVLPKLARKEVTGADGSDLFSNLKFKFGETKQD